MKFIKKHLTFSNIIFAIAIVLLLYKPSRTWFIRQIAFSPSVEKISNSKQITNYNWELEGLNTANTNFSAFKNKVVFISFWATWCPPCVAEMPSIQALYNDYKDDIVFIFITNEDKNIVTSFLTKHHYTLPVYNTFNSLKEFPEVTSIPRTFVIDKNGYIRVDKTGAANWNSNNFRKELIQYIIK